MSRKSRRKAGHRILLFLALLAFSLSGIVVLSDFLRTSAAGPMQLVRLNVTTDSGFVRIEITADGSFDDRSVEHYSRGRQSVIRIRGARSLLRQSYEINEALAREVRTVSGEREGEPFVDILISLGDGATVAQKKIFNRLVIGVAADFARLRRRANSGSTDVAKSRTETSAPSVNAAPAALSAEQAREPVNAVQNPNAQTPLASSAPQTVFRGRTIWGGVPLAAFQFSRFNTAGFAPSFFLPQTNGGTNGQPSFMSFVHMTIEPPGARRGVWVPGTTSSERDEVGGRTLGSGYLRPSFQLGATYDDNFFYRSAAGRELGIFTFAPRIEYELPGVERAMRLAFESRLRRLTNGEWANGHTLDFDARFDLTPFFRLSLRDHFVRSPLDPREYDPAGEVYIVGDTFNRNDAGLRAEYQLTDRSSLALDAGYNIVRWSEDHINAAPLFINYDELSGGVAYNRDISEESSATIAFTYSNSVSNAPLRPQFDELNNFRRYVFEIGGRTQVSKTSGMAFRVGYQRDDFTNAIEANDFSGLVFDLRFRRDLTQNVNFELAGLRKTQVSTFNLEGGNARLLSTGGAARLENTRGETIKLGLGVNYQQLDFPIAIVPTSTASGGIFVGGFAGERRKDHLYGFSLDAAYTFSELLNARFVYSFSRRDSTIPVFTFNRNRFSLVFEIGRRNDVRGRPF